MASVSTSAASRDIAGSMNRLLKLSMSIVRSLDVKPMPTCLRRVTDSEMFCSTESCLTKVAPSVTLYCTGMRMRSVSPIFAPFWAKESSYWRLMERTKESFSCRIRRASRVIWSGVRSVLLAAAMINLYEAAPGACASIPRSNRRSTALGH